MIRCLWVKYLRRSPYISTPVSSTETRITVIMYYSILPLCALFGLAHAAPSQSNHATKPDIGVPGAFEVPVEWDVQAFPEGPTLQINGTVQEVYKRLLEINPKYSLDPYGSLESRDPELTARTTFSNASVLCNPALFGWVSDSSVRKGISYLRSLQGQPRNSLGTEAGRARVEELAARMGLESGGVMM